MISVPGFEGRRVAVFGLGRSGITAARALHAGGAIPILWDDGVSGRMQAEAEGFLVEDLTTADWSSFAALVLSPGAPLTHPKPHWTVDRAHAAGVQVIGDVELFARALHRLPEAVRPRVIAITGTNGKSTTTALIGWVLKQAGLKTAIGGNIGIGVLALPAPAEVEVYVIEVSSYQLDLTTSFAPDVAILTNVSPDHLDRHGGMEGYVAAKRRLFQNPPEGGIAAIGMDDLGIFLDVAYPASDGWTVLPVSTNDVVLDGLDPAWQIGGPIFVGRAGSLSLLDGPGEALIEIADLSAARSLPGRHNAQNAAFAYAAARAVGVSDAAAVEGLMSFPGLAHRMETVGHLGSVRFVNDSKATNADAARQALASYPTSFWIAGGRAKEGGIAELADLFPRVTKAYLIGESAEDFAAALSNAGGQTPHVICGTMEAAVAAAAADAVAASKEGAGGEQVVLLSPACASFDQYPDFEVRGEAFRAAAQAAGVMPAGAVPAGAVS